VAPAQALAPGGDRLRVVLTNPDPRSQIQISHVLDRSVQRLEVAARVESGQATHVDLLVDGLTVASIEQPPYRFMWPLQKGEHTFRAIAYDGDRNQATSETVTVNVVD
jgi:hypothetical protein